MAEKDEHEHRCPALITMAPAKLTSDGPGEPGGGSGTVLCCCFNSSICCREKKGRRREGGSSGWRRPHSSKLLACRQRTCRRRFFLWRVLKWQNSQANGLAPVGRYRGMLVLDHTPHRCSQTRHLSQQFMHTMGQQDTRPVLTLPAISLKAT